MKVYSITHNGKQYEYWYDRSYRTWYAAQVISPLGDLGPTIDNYSKNAILFLVKRGDVDADNHVRQYE